MKNLVLKKITVAMLSGVLGISMFSGCGNANNSASDTSAVSGTSSASTSSSSSSSQEGDTEYEIKDGDFSLEECVKLPVYKGLKLTKTVYTVSDEYLDDYVSSLAGTVEVSDENAKVEEGNIVDIAYEGKIDGETFDGGSSDSYDLTIGSNTFIDGFEDGVIGMKKGEEKDLNLKFPDDYSASDYAGKDVVFHVTVNAIKTPEVQDDAWAETYSNGEYKTMAELRENIRGTIEENLDSNAEQTLKNDAWADVHNKTDFIILPQKYVDLGKELFLTLMETEAQTYGYSSTEEYFEAAGVDDASIEEYKQNYGESYAKSRLIAESILKAENIATDGDEVNAVYEELAESYGISVDEVMEQYGETRAYLYAICSVANDKIVEHADITEETEEYNG